MPSDLLPDDGTIEFIETCDWFGFRRGGTYASSPLGGRRGRPAELFYADELQVEFQFYERSWTAPDGPTAFSTNPDDMQHSSPWGALLATVEDAFFPFTNYFQTLWRLAWLPHLAAGDGLPEGAYRPRAGSWNWVSLKFRQNQYQSGALFLEVPMDPIQWQFGIDPLPLEFDPALRHTWPGTPWVESVLPTPGGDQLLGTSTLFPLLPPYYTVSGLGSPYRGGDHGGLMPGGDLDRVAQVFPKFNGKTLME